MVLSVKPCAKIGVDDTTLALAMLRDHGDVLSEDAWHKLMTEQAKLDKEYHERRYIERFTSGGSAYWKTADNFDRNHTPFFPNGFDISGGFKFSAAQIAHFKEWAKLRATHLPDEWIFRTEIRNYPPGSIELQLPVVKRDKRITSDFDKALTGKGYSTNQILQPDVKPWGTSSSFDTGLLEGPGKSRKPVFILPDISTHYLPSFSDSSIREIFEDRSQLAEISLRIGGSEFIPIKAKSEIFALHTAPTGIQIYSTDGREVRFEHKYDVAAIDANRLEVENPEISPPDGEALPLSAEAMDLLTVKHLPEYISEKDYLQMMQARWEYEASIPPGKDEPDWGRFFIPGKPKPDASLLLALTDRFKAWTVKRASALPEKIRLYHPHVRLVADAPLPVFASGIYQLGNLNPNDVRGKINTCKMDARSQPALAKACEYLENIYNTTPSIYPFGLGHQMSGPRLSCNSASGYGHLEIYCRARQNQFDKVSSSKSEPGFRDIFIYDKEIFFPGSHSEAVSLQGPAGIGLLVDVVVTGARAADKPLPVPFIEALIRYETFRKSLNLRDSGWREPEKASPPADYFIFDTQVISARLVKQKSLVLIRELDLRPPRSPSLNALVLPETAPAASDTPFGPEIVGLQLGMTFAEAEKVIHSHMTVDRILIRDRIHDPKALTGNIQKFSSSRIYVAKDENEYIILYDEPPAAPGVVVGITRQINFPRGQVTAATALAQLRDKYGREDWTGKNGDIGWGMGLRTTTIHDGVTHECLPATGNARSDSWAEESSAEIQWRPASGHSIPNIQLYSNADGRNCGAVLSMKFDTMKTRKGKDRLVLQLTDPNRYIKLYDESKRLIKTGEGAVGNIPAAPAIKF